MVAVSLKKKKKKEGERGIIQKNKQIRKRKRGSYIMKKYADRKDNQVRKNYETLNDVLKSLLIKSVIYEKAINEKAL